MCGNRAVTVILSALLCTAFLLPGEASALVLVGGSEPLDDAGWPTGALAVANLPTRVSYWVGPPFGGGQYCFQYRCKDTKAFNEALEAFSRIVAPRLEVIVLDGGRDDKPSVGEPADWEIMLWVPKNFYQFSRAPLPQAAYECLPAPTLTVYAGPESPIRWDEVKVPPNLHVTDKRVEVSAYRDSKGGVVEVHVFDMATGKALSGASVAVVAYHAAGEANTYRAETDARGAAVLRDIAKGAYHVTVSCQGHATRDLDPYRNFGRTLEVLNVTLSQGGSLSGRVVGPDGKPLAGVRLRMTDTVGMDGLPYGLAGSQAVTNAEGRFAIEGVPAGLVGDLLANKDGYVQTSLSQQIPARDVEIAMHFGAVVQGRVTWPKATPPDQELHVFLRPEGDPVGGWGGSQRCEADGRFAFQDVPPGRYVLTSTFNPASDRDRGRWPRKTVEVKATRPGETVEVNLEIK